MTRSVWLAAGVAGVLAGVAGTARADPERADPERYAIVAGNNLGAADEQKLRFAETDAVRVAELLSEVGGVRDENTTLLRGNTASQVRTALIIEGASPCLGRVAGWCGRAAMSWCRRG